MQKIVCLRFYEYILPSDMPINFSRFHKEDTDLKSMVYKNVKFLAIPTRSKHFKIKEFVSATQQTSVFNLS